MPVQQQPMPPMPFYADPNRFPAPVWQADPSQGWPQGQFIQQIPATGQPIETYQQYPNGIYQTTYQQPAFETNTFYTGAVQVLTNSRPPSVPNQQAQLAPPRPNSNYSHHTPSPSPAQQQQQGNRQYQEYNMTQQQPQQQQQNNQQQSFIPPSTTPTGNENSQTGSNSRPSSVNNIMNPPTPNQNFNQQPQQQQQQPPPQQQQQQQQQSNTPFTTMGNFSPNSSANYVNANSGNAQPGYPPVNSSPQLVSHSSSGYPGQEQYGGQDHQWQNEGQIMWEQQTIKMETGYEHRSEQHQPNQYMQEINRSPNKMEPMHNEPKTFSQADKVNLNTRIKTMILNKQQENKTEESKPVEQNPTGHFLWYSHHHHLTKGLSVDGGPQNLKLDLKLKRNQQSLDKKADVMSQNRFEEYHRSKGYQSYNIDNLGKYQRQTNYPSLHRPFSISPKPFHNTPSHIRQINSPKLSNVKIENPTEDQERNYSQDYKPTNIMRYENTQGLQYQNNQLPPSHQMQQRIGSPFTKPHGQYISSKDNCIPQMDISFRNATANENKRFPLPGLNGLKQIPQQLIPENTSTAHHPNDDRNLLKRNAEEHIKSEFKTYPHQFGSQEDTSMANYYMPETDSKRFQNPDSIKDKILQSTSINGFSKHSSQEQSQVIKFAASTPGNSSSKQFMPNNYDYNDYVKREVEEDRFAEMVSPKSTTPIPKSYPSPNATPLKSPKLNRSPLNQLDNFKLKNHPIPRLKDAFPEKNKQLGMEIPNCSCFPPDQAPPEPGTYYTHLGCANSLQSLRYDLECRTGVNGSAIRIEKVRYTGKEGKTALGCPIAKWVIRRQNTDEKYLVVVKHRKGHFCHSTFIVICLVVWDGVDRGSADELYSLLTDKLNKFGLPTKRRCATNEPRTCACQGIDEDTCGASFSFGCSWSMYYNGCKFARSKEVRKFRMAEKAEEIMVEEKLQSLANHLSPMYRCLAPQSFKNQCHFESIASDCRLGTNSGRPFSGVTACVDFCAHAHKDLHNMINGCTVVVSLTKHRTLVKPTDEQLHVLPMYIADDTDEFGSKDNQQHKIRSGAIEVLDKYPCEVRTCSVPAETCLRRNRKSQEGGGKRGRKKASSTPSSPSVTSTSALNSPKESSNSNSEIQNGQVSSTVLDYPITPNWRYDNFSDNSLYSNRTEPVTNSKSSFPPSPNPTLPRFSFFKTPYSPSDNPFSNHYSQNGYLRNDYHSPSNYYYTPSMFQSPATPHLSQYASQFTNYPSYNISNPFDDCYSNKTLTFGDIDTYQLKNPNKKVVDISYTDNSECFQDAEIGGVAIALQHGSVLFECAKHELHATTALKQPNRLSPTRISLVFYQHRSLNKAQHGLDEYTEKMKRKLESSGQSDLEKSDPADPDPRLECSFRSLRGERDVWPRAPTLPTVSLTTMFPMYPCIVTGPFQDQLGVKP